MNVVAPVDAAAGQLDLETTVIKKSFFTNKK
jgi:hypothetical protein